MRQLALALLLTAAAHATPLCPSTAIPPVSVPHMRAAIAANRDIVIVALGSSSTRGHLASDRAHSYPAVLQTELTRLLPTAHVAVLNRGVNGQDARSEDGRLDPDVLAVRPDVIIWQVGANGAMRGTDPRLFKQMVLAGIQHMQRAGVDIVLMDNQRAPRIMAAPGHALLDQALADLAATTGASLFSRGLLMEAWQREGYPYELFIGPDDLHHNDRGYACVGRALARAIVDGLGPAPRLTAAHLTLVRPSP